MPTEEENTKFLFLLIKHSDYSKTNWDEICDKLDLTVAAASKRMSRLRQAMAKGETTTSNGVEYLYLCLKHSDATKFDWNEVAKELDLKKGAVTKRWSRLQLSMDKDKADDGSEVPVTPKKATKASAQSSTGKKVKATPKQVAKAKVEDSDSEDPVAQSKLGTPDSLKSLDVTVADFMTPKKKAKAKKKQKDDAAVPDTPATPDTVIRKKPAAAPGSTKRKRTSPIKKEFVEKSPIKDTAAKTSAGTDEHDPVEEDSAMHLGDGSPVKKTSVNAAVKKASTGTSADADKYDPVAKESAMQVSGDAHSESETEILSTQSAKTLTPRRTPSRRAASKAHTYSTDDYFSALGVKGVDESESEDEDAEEEQYLLSAKKPKFDVRLGDAEADAAAGAEAPLGSDLDKDVLESTEV